jgi:hypothetical protein
LHLVGTDIATIIVELKLGGKEMRSSVRMLTVSALLVLGLVTLGVAQMMSGGNGHMSQMVADSSSQRGQMNIMNMMNNMSDHYMMMTSDFDSLQQHFNSMMQINDMGALKSEMKKHRKMMQTMHDTMTEQKGMFQNMMSMMHSGGMQGMMGMDGDNAAENVVDH